MLKFDIPFLIWYNCSKYILESRDNLKQKFYEYLNSVQRDGIDKLIKWIQKTDFETAPSSARYHGNYEGGLCNHSVLVYELLKEKCDYWRIKNPNIFIPDDDSIKLIALCHDLCKINFYTKGTRNVKENDVWVKKEVYEISDAFPVGHGSKSVIILQNFVKLKDYEIMSIIHHMGVPNDYVESQSFHKSLELYPFVILLHTSDFEASILLEEVKK